MALNTSKGNLLTPWRFKELSDLVVCVVKYSQHGFNVVVCMHAVSRRFCQTLKRLTSLNHLCQAARSVVHSSDVTSQMLYDWSRVDLSGICKQTIYTMDKYSERDYEMIVTREWT